jgi:hypothetical protein
MTLHRQSGLDFDNLKSAAICNRSETLYSQGLSVHRQIHAQSDRQSRNLTQTFVLKDFQCRPRFWRNSPHYMWVKPQAFRPHVDVFSPVTIF